MNQTTEAFSRVKIDALLTHAGWNLTDGVSVLFEHALPDGSRADYALCDRSGRPLAAIEAKRASIEPIEAQDQGSHYAEQLGVPFVFLSNGERVWFLDRETDAHARKIAAFYSPDDLERRIAARRNRLDLSGVEIDRRIVDRSYQIACVDALSAEVSHGRRKLLVEMATGTGKTRTAAAFVKRLFEAGIVTRVLFLVDRIALAGQAEDAFNDHLRDYPCHVLRPGRGFDRTKRITIATLQTISTEYRGLSSSYLDLLITDECHRSLHEKWSGVLPHFDGIQLGLTATPCTEQADTLPDPQDGQFVRATLRFFALSEPTFRYTLHEAINARHLLPYPIYKAMTVKTAADGGVEAAPRNSTGRRWTRRRGPSSRGCSSGPTPSPSIRRRWSARSPFRSAPAPSSASSATPTRRGSWARGGVLGGRPALAAMGQDHRGRRDEAPCRDLGGHVRRTLRRPEAASRPTLRAFYGHRHRRRPGPGCERHHQHQPAIVNDHNRPIGIAVFEQPDRPVLAEICMNHREN